MEQIASLKPRLTPALPLAARVALMIVLVAGGRFNSYGGGAGKDTFTGALGLQDSIKGGSEDDTFGAVGNGIDLGHHQWSSRQRHDLR